jgi:hypothetical protein
VQQPTPHRPAAEGAAQRDHERDDQGDRLDAGPQHVVPEPPVRRWPGSGDVVRETAEEEQLCQAVADNHHTAEQQRVLGAAQDRAVDMTDG